MLGSMLLAWVLVTTMAGLFGGFIGAFLGCLGAMFVLKRLPAPDNETTLDLEA